MKRTADIGRQRVRAALVSLVGGVGLTGAKLVAWQLTGSAAVMSDAFEGLVNIAAAGFALFSVHLAQKPADAGHPYGHGKVEFLSAGFEGALVLLASVLIAREAILRLLAEAPLAQIDVGLAIVAAAGAGNLALGLWLVGTGHRTHSPALVADGRHLLTDVWTSAIVLAGLGLVLVTGLAWLDAAVALAAAAWILRTGIRILRGAVGGIMDEADVEDLRRIDAALDALHDGRLVRWSNVRTRHHGALHHVDLVLHVAADATLAQAEDLRDRARTAIHETLHEAEIVCEVRAVQPDSRIEPGPLRADA